MGHREAASVQIELGQLWMAHCDGTDVIIDVCARRQLAEALTRCRQIFDQRAQLWIAKVATATSRVSLTAIAVAVSQSTYDSRAAGSNRSQRRKFRPGRNPGDSARAAQFDTRTTAYLFRTTAGSGIWSIS